MSFHMPRQQPRPAGDTSSKRSECLKPVGDEPWRMEADSGIKILDKLVDIIDAFNPQHPAWTLADLSAHLGIPKPSLHRFLVALEEHGIVSHQTGDGLWHLGYRLFVWGNLVPRITSLQRVAKPIVRWLSEATEETAILTAYEGKEVVSIDKVESRHAVRLTLDIGSRRPVHAGASSKVLAAYLSQEEIDAIVRDKGLPRLNTNTITDPRLLAAELQRIRDNGYALSDEETDVGAWGVATPILDDKGRVVAAIGVAGPTVRYEKQIALRYVDLCRQAAIKITQELSGGTPSGQQPLV